METEKIGLVLGLVGLAMFVLSAAIIIFHINYRANMLKLENENQLAAFKAAVIVEEQQKEKIARNLHDEIITSITLLGHHIEKRYGEDNSASELINQIVSGIQSISLDLIPKTLFSFGLVKAVEQYIRLLTKDQDIEIENNTSFEKELPFIITDQVNIYRSCLEILNNIQKHAECSYLKFTLACMENNLVIEFTHNGKGISNAEIEALSESNTGLGLKSLKSRLLILKAEVNYYKDINNSTITLFIPISDEQ